MPRKPQNGSVSRPNQTDEVGLLIQQIEYQKEILRTQEELIKLLKINAVESAQLLKESRQRQREANIWYVIFLFLMMMIVGMIVFALYQMYPLI